MSLADQSSLVLFFFVCIFCAEETGVDLPHLDACSVQTPMEMRCGEPGLLQVRLHTNTRKSNINWVCKESLKIALPSTTF